MSKASIQRGEPRQLLERLLDSADMTKAVQDLDPKVLHQLVRHVGLEECGQVIALATTEQLTQIFDEDLWSNTLGTQEQFDADRFGLWLEVLADVGDAVAAQKLVAMDFDFVTGALSRHFLVVEADLLALEPQAAAEALERNESYDFGAYTVIAKTSESWEALVSVMKCLEHDHPIYFGNLLKRCAQISTEWIVDNGGLCEVWSSDEQVMDDMAAAREERREQQGYVASSDAAVFLKVARGTPQPADAHDTAPSMALSAPSGLSRIRALLASWEDHRGEEELTYLANMLMAGCSFQSRQFRPAEAADAVLATCNLGLENWPLTDGVAHQSLVPIFQHGWRILYEDVCLFTAKRLIDALGDLQCDDRDIQGQITDLFRRMKKVVAAGTPWVERENLDVVAILDTPAWAMLVNLLDECPMIPKNACTPTDKPRLRVDTEFEFISENRQVIWARDFANSLAQKMY